jgi:hypothetical protein
VRLRTALTGERTASTRCGSTTGCPERSWLFTDQGRAWLAHVELPMVARQTVDLAARMTDHIDTELDQMDAILARIARGGPNA